MTAVLIVDSDQGFCSLLSETLQERGYTAYTANLPSQALSILESRTVDLLLVEGLLPEMKGHELIKEIRRRGVESPIIFASARSVFTRNHTIFSLLTKELGVYKILSKPINMDELLMYVEYLAPLYPVEPTDGDLGAAHATLGALPVIQQSLPHTTSQAASQLEKAREAFYPELSSKLYQVLEEVSLAHRDTNQVGILFQTHRSVQKIHNTAGTLGLQILSDVLGQIERGLYLLLNPKEFLASSSNEISQNPWLYLQERLEWCISQASQPAEEQNTTYEDSQSDYFNLLVIGKRIEEVGEMAYWASRHRIQLHAGENWEKIERLLKRHAFDAFYLDVSTPSAPKDATTTQSLRQQTAAIQSGVSWIQRLRQRPGMEQLPVMFVTDQAELHHRMMASQITPSQLLIKPLQEHTWLDALRRMTGHQAVYSSRILSIPDDTGFSQLVEQALHESGFLVERLNSPIALLEELEAQEPDLLMVGFSVPGFSGLDLCRMLRINPRWGDLPVLLMAPSLATSLRASAFQTGVHGILTQQQSYEEITSQVQMHLQQARQHGRARYRDSLTNLLRRDVFLDRLERRFSEARESEHNLHLCLLRPKDWENLAQQHGYVLRAQVLVHLSHLISQHTPSFALSSRLDTCTLALLLPSMSSELVIPILQQIEQDFTKIQFAGKSRSSFQTSLDSVHVSLQPQHEDALDLFQEAQEVLENIANLG
ncbi:MAG: response regulator [Myxococcales bacterium]|nr:response regulator [Myxococcales bacterium]MCB9642298.1 response regulator [Myxococcales bacterium]